jgi:hypothetical protein
MILIFTMIMILIMIFTMIILLIIIKLRQKEGYFLNLILKIHISSTGKPAYAKGTRETYALRRCLAPVLLANHREQN